jgi:hypothetical protein
MRQRRILAGLAALLALAVLAVTAGTLIPAAHAAGTTTIKKAILAETSIAPPALWTPDPATSGNAAVKAVIAWAGTDSAHRLNVATSADSLSYRNKITLSETSNAKPAVVATLRSDGQLGPVLLAWTGTDGRLRLMWDVYGSRKKVTLGETSISSPSLVLTGPVTGPSSFALAWTGTDTNRPLNVRRYGLNSALSPESAKEILAQFHSDNAPTLAVAVETVYISFSDRASRRIYTAREEIGIPKSWSLTNSGEPQASFSPPSLRAVGTSSKPLAYLYRAWTGTNASRSLNIQRSAGSPSWTGPVATLNETCLGGPSLGQVRSDVNRIIVAWTGTDTAHHLNVADLQVSL